MIIMIADLLFAFAIKRISQFILPTNWDAKGRRGLVAFYVALNRIKVAIICSVQPILRAFRDVYVNGVISLIEKLPFIEQQQQMGYTWHWRGNELEKPK